MDRYDLFAHIPGRHLAAALLAASLIALPLPAAADCLTGTGAVGMETGNQTLYVSLTNMSATPVNLSAICGPSTYWVDPGVSNGSSGRAEFTTGSGGYSIHARIVGSTEFTGLASATAAGSVRYAFSVIPEPGYTGPDPVDVDLFFEVDASGSGSASGLGSSFSGTYSSGGSIKEAGGLGTTLFSVGGATATASPTLFTPTHGVRVGRDYIISLPVTIQVQAYTAYDNNAGTIGSAESSGKVLVSWGAVIAEGFEDGLLSLEFEMVEGPLGLDPPSVGSAPPLPSDSAVPLVDEHLVLVLPIALAMLGVWALARTRSRDARV